MFTNSLVTKTVGGDNIWKVFDDLFQGFDTLMDVKDIRYPAPSFPPVDVFINEDGSMNFKFALSGYTKDDITATFENNHLVLSSSKDTEEEDKGKKFIKRSIKKAKFEYRYFVPFEKFKTDEAKAKFENGLLEISIPPNEKVSEKKTLLIEG